MATLSQLQRLYSQIVKEEQGYWEELVQLVDDLQVRLGIVLGVDPKTSDLIAVGLVREGGEFIKAAPRQLKRTDRALSFAVKITLSQTQSLVPPNELVSQWDIKQTSAGLQLINKDGGISQFTDIGDVAAHIADAFETKISNYSPYLAR